MADERINSFVTDEAKAELAAVIEDLRAVTSEIVNANNAARNAEGFTRQAKSMEDLAKGATMVVDANGKMVGSFEDFIRILATGEAVKAKYNGSTKDVVTTTESLIRITEKQAKADAAAAKAQEAKTRATAAEAKEQERLATNQAKAADAASRAEAKKISDIEKRLNKESAAADRIAAAKEKAARKQDAADDKAFANAKKLADAEASAARAAEQKAAINAAANDSLKAMSATLEQARKSYALLTASERENANIGGVLLTRIQELDAALKSSDATQGKFTRNVGNYASAFSGLNFSIRNIAGELPNIGLGFRTFATSLSNNIGPLSQAIADAREQNKAMAAEGKATVPIGKQIAGAIFNWQTAILALVAAFVAFAPEIESFFKGLFNGKQAVDAAKLATEEYNKVLSSSELTNAVAEYERLEEIVRLGKQGYINSSQALGIYNDALGDTFGQAKNLNEAEATLIRNKDAYIEMIKAKTAATTFYTTAATKLAQSQLILAKVQQGDISFLDLLKDATSNFAKFGMLTGTGAVSATAAAKDLEKEADILNKAADAFIKKATGIGAKIGANPFGKEGLDKAKKGKSPVDLTKEELTADVELAKEKAKTNQLLAQQEAAAQKAIAEDEKRTLDERLEAYNQYILAKLDAAGFGAQAELDAIQTQLKKIAQIEAKPASKRTKEENDILRNKELLNQRLINLQIEYNTEIAAIQEEGFDAQDKLTDKADKDAIAATKDRYKKAVELARQGIKDINEATADEKDQAKKKEAERDKLVGASIEFAQNLSGFESTLAQRRIADLDNEIQKIHEKRDAEINAINAAGGTEEERTKKIAAANIKAAAEEKRLDQEKIQRQRRAAAFEKAATIGQIIAQTSLAVVKALPNYILAAVVAASGALALAKAIATPLPQYEHGTQGKPHKGGPAKLFEKGKTEAVIEPGKPVWFGNTEGIYDLAKGAQVLSQDQLIKLTQQYAVGMPALVPVAAQGGKLDTSGLEREMQAVRHAIESKPTAQTSITGSGIEHVVMAGQHLIRYELNLKR